MPASSPFESGRDLVADSEDLDRVTLADAYALETPDDNRKLYARWAATYESEFVESSLYVIPQRVAAVFVDVFGHDFGDVPVDVLGDAADSPDEHAVLDIGCGTGLTAHAVISSRPDLVVDGIDISPEMLAMSARKRRADGSPLYRRLIEADLTEHVPIDDSAYSGVFSSGTFTHGHLLPAALRGLIRLGRRRCVFAIGINSEHFEAFDFRSTLQAELAAGTITDLEPRVVEMYLPGSDHFGDTAVVAVFRRA